MEEEHYMEKPRKQIKTTKKHWQILTIVFIILFAISIITAGFRFGTSADSVKTTLEELSGSTVKDIDVENGLYKATIVDDEGSEGVIYVSKDGKLLFQGAVDVDALREYIASMEEPTGSTVQETKEYPKTDKPNVELFVMSYCPYGLQAQQLMVPVMELLKDKAEITVKFVSYIMHDKKEIDENNVQYCIQRDQPERFVEYLKCFVGSKSSKDCQQSAGVNIAKMQTCIDEIDKEYKITESYEDKATWLNGQFPLYNVNKEDNEKYSVRGSPTLLINGVEYEGSRSSDLYKKAICEAFNEAPEECSTNLYSQETTTDGQC